MRQAWAIYKRELLAAYCTPLAYVALVVFMLWNGGVFSLLMANFAANPEAAGSRGPLQLLFGSSVLNFLLVLIFCAALTMRTFAEERRAGTLEALLTAPVREAEAVLGKYLAVLTVYASLWVPTLLFALVVRRYGPVDWGALGASYAGVVLMGGAFLALGVLMSAAARSQVAAFIATFAATGGMFLLGLGKFVMTEERYQTFFAYVSLWDHMEQFSLGVVDTRNVVYYASVAALGLFLAVRVLEARRSA